MPGCWEGDERGELGSIQKPLVDTWRYLRSDYGFATFDRWCVVLRRLDFAQPVGQLSIKCSPYIHDGFKRELRRALRWLASLGHRELAGLGRTIGGVP